MKEVQSYIADGYTELGYIEPEANLWPELRFKYRPMLKTQRALLFSNEASALPEDDQARNAAKAIVAQLESWEVRDATGSDVAITVDNVLRIKQFDQLLAIVSGLRPSDTDPQWSEDRKNSSIADKLDGAFQERSEDDAKN